MFTLNSYCFSFDLLNCLGYTLEFGLHATRKILYLIGRVIHFDCIATIREQIECFVTIMRRKHWIVFIVTLLVA